VRLVSDDGALDCIVSPPGGDWAEVAIPLPEMTLSPGFDPKAVKWFQLFCYNPEPFTLEIDDIRLVPGEGGWRREEKAAGERHLVADFEAAGGRIEYAANRSKAERVPSDEGAEGHCLRWIQAAAKDGGWLTFTRVPEDIRPYRRLRFRARLVAGGGQKIYVRFRSDAGDLGATLPEIGTEWQIVDLLLPEMYLRDFDPKERCLLRLVCFETAGFTLEIDDVELLREGDGWRYSPRERLAMGIDPAAPRYCIADFGRERDVEKIIVEDSSIERFPLGKGRRSKKGHAIRWTFPKDGPEACLTFTRVPADIREYRSLRLRARASRPLKGAIRMRLRSWDGELSHQLTGLSGKWRTFEVLLPRMSLDREFKPEAVMVFRLFHRGSKGLKLELDDIELVKGAGGWKKTKAQHLADVFGEDRAKKVKVIETDHFEIWTDSKTARKKFPKALEQTYEYVCKELGIEGMRDRLPVYIFQSSKLYHDFCVRKGWTRDYAEQTAGHAARGYFATYYQAPKSAVVTHELTHSIFHRSVGDMGGSWLQEGVAVYVEERWQKKDPAQTFAPLLRSGKYVPLSEFITMESLAAEEDITGGARTAGALYQQAGAFFAFLLRGPFSQRSSRIVGGLALLDPREEGYEAEIERVFGVKIEDVERAWLDWGKKPPKAKGR